MLPLPVVHPCSEQPLSPRPRPLFCARSAPPLSWSPEAAQTAQEWANTCAFDHSYRPNTGENLSKAWCFACPACLPQLQAQHRGDTKWSLDMRMVCLLASTSRGGLTPLPGRRALRRCTEPCHAAGSLPIQECRRQVVQSPVRLLACNSAAPLSGLGRTVALPSRMHPCGPATTLACLPGCCSDGVRAVQLHPGGEHVGWRVDPLVTWVE
jgi:hypothetical protein